MALEAAGECHPDVVFLDIDMPGLGGLELALGIQANHPGVIVIFVTAHAQYALEAFRAFPLDFLLKPIKEARLDETVKHLRVQHKLLHPVSPEEREVRIRCFGRFELLAGDEVKWETRRVRELLLYLIDRRGEAPSRDELLEALFGGRRDRNTLNNLRMTVFRLRNLIHALDAEGKYLRMGGDYSLTITRGVCDFTDFMAFARGNAAITDRNAAEAARALNLCRGPYLENEGCEWAQESAREVEAEYERIALGLAGCHAAAGRVPEAESILDAMLARNPISTEAYAALFDLYMSAGNRTAFRVRYQQYVRMLKKEYRVRPPARYREFYEHIDR
jgi:two-component SAPR family response regulator